MDRNELEAWLNTRPRRDAILFAQRAALRVFPIWGAHSRDEWARIRDVSSLPILRALLSSGVACIDPTPEAKSAVALAANGASIAADVADAAVAMDAAHAGLAAAQAACASQEVGAASAANTHFDALSSYAFASGAVDAAADVTTFSAAVDSSVLWSAVERDLALLTAGDALERATLWPDAQPSKIAQAELEALENLARETGERNSFWHRWWFAMKRGEPMDWDLQREVALIPDEVWNAGPKAVMAEIEKIEARYRGSREQKGKSTTTVLARAYAFDFVEHDRQLRLTGVVLDFEGKSAEDIEKCLKALRDWKENLSDWVDYARDALRQQNDESILLKSATKLVNLVERITEPRDFPASRLISMGRDLRLLGLNGVERAKVGDTLAEMLDQRVDELSRLLGDCFGHVLARLEPLNDLQLGKHDPEKLITDMRGALDRLKSVDPAELMPLNDGARAALAEQLRELQELGAAISDVRDPKQVAVLKSRFASRFGELGNTIGRRVEVGRKFGTKVTSKFDDAVKWYKRWETLDKIVEWLQSGNWWP